MLVPPANRPAEPPARNAEVVALTVKVYCCGGTRARSHYRVVLPTYPLHKDSLKYSVPLFLKRQCDRTLGGATLELVAPAAMSLGAVRARWGR